MKMHKILLFILVLTVFSMVSSLSYAETKTVILNGTFGSSPFFSIEFYQDNNTLYTTLVPFTNMDASSNFVMADNRAPYDGKNDVSVLVRTNLNIMWYLKMSASATPSIFREHLKFYLGQPWNRSYNPPWGGAPADGELTIDPPDWTVLPQGPWRAYSAGPHDKINTPGGTLCSYSFAANPGGLDSTTSYQCAITLTLSTTP